MYEIPEPEDMPKGCGYFIYEFETPLEVIGGAMISFSKEIVEYLLKSRNEYIKDGSLKVREVEREEFIAEVEKFVKDREETDRLYLTGSSVKEPLECSAKEFIEKKGLEF